MEEPIPNLSSQFSEPDKKGNLGKKLLPALLIVLVLGAGVFTGWRFSAQKISSTAKENYAGSVNKSDIKKGSEYGVSDTGNFMDQAIGVLQAGGIEGEGTHHLVREGGPSQTVYLTSSFLDLDLFVGRKIQVWGATMTAKKAGWLMDVGKVKVLE